MFFFLKRQSKSWADVRKVAQSEFLKSSFEKKLQPIVEMISMLLFFGHVNWFCCGVISVMLVGAGEVT